MGAREPILSVERVNLAVKGDISGQHSKLILTKHLVGGRSQSWLVITNAQLTWEVVIEFWCKPYYEPWASKWGCRGQLSSVC